MTQVSNKGRDTFSIPMPSRRQTLMLVGFATIGGGSALNWDWLTAVGLAPLILSLAPCAAMCALGLCMRGGSASCAKNDPALKPEISND
ncbi:hypothetical protein SAMN04488523_10812 [Sulfitobacter brevis]|uniref:Uncharacterized protein n=1 Tax=Sulfitobacter brevis TaxID=74348 RepID=A0A1I2B733_9RHOB|nr:hypothetical protein [Sulfitobacter brevis]SFE51961.1 hypothetical protein SAMN04488523_10812 [Sulfitobacter brevis]